MKPRIVVIGGGIAGVSAAARLAPDADVTLLEAETHLAHHASGRSAAMFLEQYGNATIRALNSASAPFLREASVLSPRGMMMVGLGGEEEAFDSEAGTMDLDPIPLDRAAEFWPILNRNAVTRAAYRDDAFDLDTDALIQTFRKTAIRHGAGIVTGTRITGIERTGKNWRIVWDGGDMTADHVVNAAGAWAGDVARMAGAAPVGLQPYRRSMARLAAPGGHDVSRWPFVDGVGEAWYAKPDAGAWLVSPSEEEPMDAFDAWPDDIVLAEGLDRYSRAVTHEITRPIATWAGLRTFAADRALVVGADPKADGVWWLAGQGGYGFQTAPAASALLADLMMDRAPDLAPDVVTALSPTRLAA